MAEQSDTMIYVGFGALALAIIIIRSRPCQKVGGGSKLFYILYALPTIIVGNFFLGRDDNKLVLAVGISFLLTSLLVLTASFALDHLKYKQFIEWLNNVGFGLRKNAPGDIDIWKKAEKNKIAILVDNNNLMSTSFAQSVSKKICNESFLWKTEVETICRQFAPSFQASVDAVSAIGAIVSVLLRDVKKIYAWGTINDYFFLDDDFLTSFYDVIKDLGMATTSEYTAACRKSEKLKPALPYMVSVCPVVLEQLAKTEKVRKARIDDGETEAYQAVGVEVGSNMVCTELDIDWDD